jgi:iron only hydrogenase large subunit-like protein
MSAILSSESLNDFISPGVACIKPIEDLQKENQDGSHVTIPNSGDLYTSSNALALQNLYEVTTEDKLASSNPKPASISLTDCLACSGCVTSAEAVLVSLQSHAEVLNTLDEYPSLIPPWSPERYGVERVGSFEQLNNGIQGGGMIFVASVSPQTRANLAAALGISYGEAGNMISQLLSGPQGLAAGGQHGSSFLWVMDTNILRSAALVLAAEEVSELLRDGQRTTSGDGSSIDAKPTRPILTSACPGWICYAEKTHPHILPHLSRLKSPQALAGTLIKSVLAQRYNVPASRIWHLAVMPCFDKKLEASRSELTSAIWNGEETDPVRDVDCVITARELISLASARGISFADLSRSPLPHSSRTPFPDPALDAFLFPPQRQKGFANAGPAAGTSGGYLWHILQRLQNQQPGSRTKIERGRNADVMEYVLFAPPDSSGHEAVVLKLARYYGFRNIQNLVRKLKPAKPSRLLAAAAKGGARRPGQVATSVTASEVDYAYVEVMACPGGCTNGGGQIRAGEAAESEDGLATEAKKIGPAEQKAWLAKVDEAYYSADSDDDVAPEADCEDTMDTDAPEIAGAYDAVDGISRSHILGIINHWSSITSIDVQNLVCTSYRKVESDVGKNKASDVDRVAGLASSIGGGW